MPQLTIDNATAQVIPHGLVMRYSTEEITAITDLRHFTEDYQKRKGELAWKLYLVKLQLDGDDAAEGRNYFGSGTSPAGSSRFWGAIESGDLGEYWQERCRSSIKNTLNAVNQAVIMDNVAGQRVASYEAPTSLNLSQSALIKYGQLTGEALELANLCYKVRGFVSEKLLRSLERLCNRYPQLVAQVKEGIQFGQYKVPDDVDSLMDACQKRIEVDAAANNARKLEAARLAALQADELQDLADNKAKAEASEAVEIATDRLPPTKQPPKPKADEVIRRGTYPIQEIIDGTAYSGLQKQFEEDSAEYLVDMREMYAALRTAEKLSKKWERKMQERYGTSSVGDMLIWETFSRVWKETGKFKKLGNVSHASEVYSLFQGIAKNIRHSLAVAEPLTKLSARWGELVECRTAEEQKKYKRT